MLYENGTEHSADIRCYEIIIKPVEWVALLIFVYNLLRLLILPCYENISTTSTSFASCIYLLIIT